MAYDLTQLKSHGDDVVISDFAEIRRPHLVSIGNHAAIDSFVTISTGAEIGDYVHISPHVSVIGGATGMLRMGHFTNLAAGCRIICGSDGFLGHGLIGSAAIPPVHRDKMKVVPVTLANFANIGSNAVIMPGVTLGEGSVVAACAFVNRDTEPWIIYAGVPARPIKARRRDLMLGHAKSLGY